MKETTVFLDIAPSSLVEFYRALMMEAGSTSETSVKFYQFPDDSNLHTNHSENLKCHKIAVTVVLATDALKSLRSS
jgi:hypothetical protein